MLKALPEDALIQEAGHTHKKYKVAKPGDMESIPRALKLAQSAVRAGPQDTGTLLGRKVKYQKWVVHVFIP